MTELISSLVSQLGIDKGKAENGMGALLNTVKENASGDIFSSLSSAIPGADTMLSGFANQKESGDGGVLGSVSKLAGGLFGGQSDQLTSLVSNFSKAGFSLDMVKQFLPVAFDFLKNNISSEKLSKISGAIPGLDGLLGGSKSGGLMGKLSKLF